MYSPKYLYDFVIARIFYPFTYRKAASLSKTTCNGLWCTQSRAFSDVRIACRMSICILVETFLPPKWSCDRLECLSFAVATDMNENTTVNLMPSADSRTRKTIPDESSISPKIGKRFFFLIFFLTLASCDSYDWSFIPRFCENGFVNPVGELERNATFSHCNVSIESPTRTI